MKIVPYKTWDTKLYLTKLTIFFENCNVQKFPFLLKIVPYKTYTIFVKYNWADVWESLSDEISKNQLTDNRDLQNKNFKKSAQCQSWLIKYMWSWYLRIFVRYIWWRARCTLEKFYLLDWASTSYVYIQICTICVCVYLYMNMYNMCICIPI